MDNKLRMIRLLGNDINSYLTELAQLRLNVFRSYPYLYDGTLDYETRYLKTTYVDCPFSIAVFILDGNKLVGASTGLPLVYETKDVKKPFMKHDIDPATIFYFGESVLLPEYRGQHIYRIFFKEREAQANSYHAKIAAFAAINRPSDDPRRPVNYASLDQVWHYFGYKEHPELSMKITWKEVGEKSETPKSLTFWLKEL